MSSHHFVKEGQEPALLILDPFALDPIEPLLEWAPLVVVVDQALEKVLHWGFKIDVVVTIPEQIEELTNRVAHQMPLTILHSRTNESALTTALSFLIEKKQSSVNIIAENAESVIRFLGDGNTGIDISILSPAIRWSLIPHGQFTKWFPADSHFLLKRSGEVQVTLNDQPLIKETTKEASDLEVLVSSDGIVSIVSKSAFWIGESLDG